MSPSVWFNLHKTRRRLVAKAEQRRSWNINGNVASRNIIYYVDITIYQQSCAFGYWNMFRQLCLRCRSVIDLPQGLSGAAELGLSFIQITANLTCHLARPLSTDTTFGLKSIPKQWWMERVEQGRDEQTRKSHSAWHLPGLYSVNNQAIPASDTPNPGLLLNNLLKDINPSTSHT